jgi:uncharacterized membrane protein YhfC
MKAGVLPDRLKTIWQGLVAQYGAFEQVTGTRVQKAQQYDAVFVTCKFAKATLDLRVVYDSSRQIAGFFYQPAGPAANQPSDALLASLTFAALFAFAYPLILGGLARSRLHAAWRYFAYGMAIFIVFQIVTRIPLITLVQSRIAPQLQASRPLLVAWVLIASLTAGIFEEVGRYVGYRWLFKPEQRTWKNGVMYGLGHGGVEAMVLLGISYFSALSLLISGQARAAADPALAAQLGAITSQPAWIPLIAAWERLWAVALHVGFSVLVLQVFRRGGLRWLWLAILLHGLADFVIAGIPALLQLPSPANLLLPEALATVVGILAVWWILRSREPEPPRGPFAGVPVP